jgi:hypothetical protein
MPNQILGELLSVLRLFAHVQTFIRIDFSVGCENAAYFLFL